MRLRKRRIGLGLRDHALGLMEEVGWGEGQREGERDGKGGREREEDIAGFVIRRRAECA